MIGLVSTTTAGGRTRYTECALDHPCEPTLDSEVSRTETSYVTPLVGIDRCFQAGRFHLMAPECPLDPGHQVSLTPSRLGYVNPALKAVPIGRTSQRWNVTVSGPFELYRYKAVAVGAGDCRDVRGYSPARPVRDRPVIDDPLAARDGWWFLCVIGGGSARGVTSWQPAAFATVVAARVDSLRPRIAAPLTIEENDVAWHVTFRTLQPEIATYHFKFGRPAETRCAEPAGYRVALVPFTSLPKRDRPYVFCAIPYDSAGNPGAMIESVLP